MSPCPATCLASLVERVCVCVCVCVTCPATCFATNESDVQAHSSLDSTLVPGVTTESTKATCSVDPGGSYRDTKLSNTDVFYIARIMITRSCSIPTRIFTSKKIAWLELKNPCNLTLIIFSRLHAPAKKCKVEKVKKSKRKKAIENPITAFMKYQSEADEKFQKLRLFQMHTKHLVTYMHTV